MDLNAYVGFFGSDHVARDPLATPLNMDRISIEDAYLVQELIAAKRVAGGEAVTGYKVGCTSRAIREQFGLSEPIYARLFASEIHDSGGSLNWGDYHQPAVEPEFVMGLGRDLVEEIEDEDELRGAVDFVAPGIELHHYHFWFAPPTSQELIASNGIHAGLVVGPRQRPKPGLGWNRLEVSLRRNDVCEASGLGEEIMGGPLTSLRWLANRRLREGVPLKTGDLVIPGSPVELIRVESGDRIEARLDQIGAVSARFVEL